MNHLLINLQNYFKTQFNRVVAVDLQERGEAQLGHFFNILMVISTGIVLLLTIVLLSLIPLKLTELSTAYVATSFPLIVILLSIYCIIQTKNGHIRPSINLYVYFHLIAISFAIFLFDGILSPGWILYIWTITIAGTLLTPIYAIWMTVGVVAYFFTLFFLARFGFYQPPLTFGSGREYVETACLLIMLVSTVGLLTYLNMKSFRKTVGDLNKEIAERKLVEMALHLNEEKYRTVANFTYDWEAWRAPNGIYRYISRSCERITGHTVDEFLADPDLTIKITHPDDRAKVIAHNQTGFHEARGEALEFDFRIITPEGKTRWINHSCTAVYGSGGQWLGRRLSNRDITERKQVEDALHESEERYRSLSEAAQDFIFIINQEGTFHYINSFGALQLGKKAEEIVGLNWENIFNSLPSKEESEAINRVFTEGISIHFECQIAFSQHMIWFSIKFVPLRNYFGEIDSIMGIARDITERKQAEEKIAAFALRYQTLLQTASDGIHILDTHGNLVEANEAFCNMLGYTREEIFKLNVADWDMQWSREKLLEDLQEFIIHPTVFETIHRRKDGTLLDVEINNVSLTLEGQNYLYAASRDITQRKKIENKIQEQVRLLDLIFRHSPDGIVLLDKNYNFIRVSQSYAKFCNRPLSDFIGRNHFEMYPSSLKDEFDDAIQKNISYTAYSRPFIFPDHPDWGTTYWDLSMVAIKNVNNIIELILFTLKDVTQRKRAEESLQESEFRFKQVSENASEWIWEVDSNGLFTYVSPIIKELLGYEVEEVIGSKYFYDFFDPEKREEVKRAALGAFARKEKFKNFINCDVHKDGRKIILSTTGFPLIDKAGNLTGYRGVDVDITERMRIEEEIKLKNEQLVKLNSEKDKFFSIIAHDLRSPFQGFLALTELAVEDIGDFPKEYLSTLLKRMNSSANNLYKLLSNLLEWAQMQKGTMLFSPKEFQLSPFVNQTTELLSKVAEEKGIEIIIVVPKEQSVYADEAMLNSIFRNLLSNSIKFSLRSSKVNVNVKPAIDGMVQVSISDNGIGISEDLMKKLFTIGEKVGRKGTEDEDSTGLGLLLCKEFVEKHGGRIWAESEEGKGSTFYFTLPEHLSLS